MGAIFDAEARIALLFLWSQLRERKPLPGYADGLRLYFFLAERSLTPLLRKI
jgi:hypothetical protein